MMAAISFPTTAIHQWSDELHRNSIGSCWGPRLKINWSVSASVPKPAGCRIASVAPD